MITKIKELLSSFSKKETEIDDKDNIMFNLCANFREKRAISHSVIEEKS